MKSNLIKIVEQVEKEYQMGMPDGLTNEFLVNIRVLFGRINELERALIPFARAYSVNKPFKEEMLNIYKSDCENAFDMLDSRKGIQLPKAVEIPAE